LLAEADGVKVLITGGAGFIGSRLAARLAESGDTITVFDNLSPQIHGVDAGFSAAVEAVAICIRGDVRDRSVLAEAILGQEVIVHLAAETGTGQSMYAVEHYSDVNLGGTALLLDLLVNQRPPELRKLIVASSRAVYGEGQYDCARDGVVVASTRTAQALADGRFDPVCPVCNGPITLQATGEDTPFAPVSFYGLTKQVQEQMVLMFARVLGLDAFALRYQNVYGPGQSLTNPYTGILAVFSGLVRQGKPINVFEDGEESRDFVYIDDVVAATAACIAPDSTGVHSLNVGSGVRTSVGEVAEAIARYFKADVAINVTGDFRVGDIRHNFADLTRLKQVTGFQPTWAFVDGLERFLAWTEQHEPAEAGYEASLAELKSRGLMGAATAEGRS
jgi:dTDP-L-rhamnose 4-epimerase